MRLDKGSCDPAGSVLVRTTSRSALADRSFPIRVQQDLEVAVETGGRTLKPPDPSMAFLRPRPPRLEPRAADVVNEFLARLLPSTYELHQGP
jgi:hypothetical protein